MKSLVLTTALLFTGLFFAAAQGTPTAPTTATPSQPETWQGLKVPNYPGATNLSVSSDEDEYELYF